MYSSSFGLNFYGVYAYKLIACTSHFIEFNFGFKISVQNFFQRLLDTVYMKIFVPLLFLSHSTSFYTGKFKTGGIALA